MKEIIDTIVFVLFALILAFFIIGLNKQQIQKHKEKLDKMEKKNND